MPDTNGTYVRTDRRTDGLTDGRTDGRMDKAATICYPEFFWGA